MERRHFLGAVVSAVAITGYGGMASTTTPMHFSGALTGQQLRARLF